MEDEFVVERGVSRYGLHTVKVLRTGQAVEREGRLQEVLAAGADRDRMVWMEWHEQSVDLHYLQVWWKEIGDDRGYDDWIG